MMPAPVTSARRFDGMAALLSSLCLWHCLALPLLLGLVPVMVPLASILHGPGWLHWLLIALALPVSGWALWRGLAIHHDYWPLAMAAAGFALMAAGALAHHAGVAEQILSVAGGLVVALAHGRNWALQRLAASVPPVQRLAASVPPLP